MATPYITLDELADFGAPPAALRGIDETVKLKAILAASSEADSYLQARYGTPLTLVPDVLKKHIARLASADLLDRRGRSPDGDDKLISDYRNDAIRYFQSVAKGLATLGPVETAPAHTTAPDVDSECDRGWSRERV